MTDTWTSPAGQEFTGTPEYIVGVKAGWDARGPVQHRADRLAAQRHNELCHPDDIANHPDGRRHVVRPRHDVDHHATPEPDPYEVIAFLRASNAKWQETCVRLRAQRDASERALEALERRVSDGASQVTG